MVPACVVTTVAGVGTVAGNLDGVGSGAQFNGPTGLVWDGAFGIVVAGFMWVIQRWHQRNCINHKEEVEDLLRLTRSDKGH